MAILCLCEFFTLYIFSLQPQQNLHSLQSHYQSLSCGLFNYVLLRPLLVHNLNFLINNLLAIQRDYVFKLEIIQTISFFLVFFILKSIHQASIFVQIPNELQKMCCPLVFISLGRLVIITSLKLWRLCHDIMYVLS